jgi:hypothetical protein
MTFIHSDCSHSLFISYSQIANDYLAMEFDLLLRNRNFMDALSGHLPGDSGSQMRYLTCAIHCERSQRPRSQVFNCQLLRRLLDVLQQVPWLAIQILTDAL